MDRMSKAEADKLSESLRNSKTETPVTTSMMRQRSAGARFSRDILTKELMYTLSVKESCPDILIGAIFEINHREIKKLRESYGITDKELPYMRAEYKLYKLATATATSTTTTSTTATATKI